MIMKIAHIADTHLRQRQYGNPTRGEDFLNGLLSAIKAAHASGARVILAAGDILDSTNPGPQVCITQLDTVNNLLIELNMVMLVISGNHDKTSPNWCERFEDCDDGAAPGIKVINNQTYVLDGKISVVGIPFMSDSELRARLAADDIPHGDILMWHGAIAEFTGYVAEGVITMEELTKDKRWKLIAMGHLHIHNYKESNGVIAAYPGSTELLSVSEDFDKKLYVYDWDCETGTFEIESVPFHTREKQKFEIDTEEELDKAVSEFEESAVIFVKYNSKIPNARLRMQTAVKPTNILRAVPYAKTSKRAVDVSRHCDVGDPVTFLNNNINKLVKDPEQAKRIRGIASSMLSEGIDAGKELEGFINNTLGQILI